MHLDFPFPNWPSLDWRKLTGLGKLTMGLGGGHIEEKGGCILITWTHAKDCTIPIRMIVTQNLPPILQGFFPDATVSYDPDGCEKSVGLPIEFIIETREGNNSGHAFTWEILPYFKGVDIYLTQGFPSHKIFLSAKGPKGSWRGFLHEMDCEACTCGVDPVLAFDDANTSDTIVKNNSITVYVTGGCPPFTWAAPGTGYSWASGETTARENVLSCVDGACGAQFAAYATVTVTDKCTDSFTTYIRNTSGQWNYAGFRSGGYSSDGNCVASNPPSPRYHYGVSNMERWEFNVNNDCNKNPVHNWTDPGVDAWKDPVNDCGTLDQCLESLWDAGDCDNQATCKVTTSGVTTYQVWGC